MEINLKEPSFIPTANLAPENWLDISNEKQRTYIFANRETVVIDFPVRIHITRKENGDSHRIVDAQGRSWYIPAGWFGIMFETKNGADKFQL